MASRPGILTRAAAVAAALVLSGCRGGDETVDLPLAGDATTPPVVAAPEPSPVAATPARLPPLAGLGLEIVAEGLTEPILAVSPLADQRIFVVERRGVVKIVSADGTLLEEPFLDLRTRINAASIEQGLLGLAFHPDYATNGRLFLYHSLASNNNQLVEYRVGDDGDRADPESARVLRVFEKEPDKVRHNGGMVTFGPDGYLYVSVGDGARASVNGQDPTTLLGTILRLDVDTGDPYGIPPDNPFVDGGGAAEVFLYGLRNPWRFSIDPIDELVWIGDVGQESFEEIDVVPLSAGGANLGWPIMEGDASFYGGNPGGPTTELTAPLTTIGHDDSDGGCSVTGGWVYRGAAIPELDGTYFYADWCRGWIRSLRHEGGQVVDQRDWSDDLPGQMISSFGVDRDGELLVVDYTAGTVSRVVAVR